MDAVKRPDPRSCCAEPRLRGTSTRRKSRERAGNERGAGKRKSYGWQTSIGRIARLGRREVARPRGGIRALAGRKPEAPPDAGHGWREGETVRGLHAPPIRNVWRPGLGFRLGGSRYDGRRSWALARSALTGGAKRSSLAGRSTSRTWSARSVLWSAHRAVRKPTRACLAVTTERQRSARFGEGSSRSEKAQGESASSAQTKMRRTRGAPGRDWLKLATANSFADSSPAWPRERPGSWMDTRIRRRRWRVRATARLATSQEAGRNEPEER